MRTLWRRLIEWLTVDNPERLLREWEARNGECPTHPQP